MGCECLDGVLAGEGDQRDLAALEFRRYEVAVLEEVGVLLPLDVAEKLTYRSGWYGRP